MLYGCSATVLDWVITAGLSRQPDGFHTRDAIAVEHLSGFDILNPLFSILKPFKE